jgi:hypothetical protein
MGIRDAFNAVPAKPIILTAMIFTIAAAGWHGWNLNSVCNHRAKLTNDIHRWAETALRVPGTIVRLASATQFEWDEVRIAHPRKINTKAQNCPFGWHWSNDTRLTLMTSGNLTLLGFIKNGKLIEIVDVDRRKAKFEAGPDAILRANAVFKSNRENRLELATP